MGMEKNKGSHSVDSGSPYSEKFFRALEAGSLQSAKEIVPLVVEFLRPASVVDVGCGTGAWLSVFREQGIRGILGIDGGYVDLSSLLVLEESF